MIAALPSAAAADGMVSARNGVLLLASPRGTTFAKAGGASAPMLAGNSGTQVFRPADCYPGIPSELFTVRPDGTGVAAVGAGDVGEFSPDGRLLVTSALGAPPGCSSYNTLSVARSPFHHESPIPNGTLTGGPFAFGPWLGAEDPTFMDANGTYRDGITGRSLIGGAGPNASMSCAGQLIDPSGRIGTPSRVSGQLGVTWQEIVGAEAFATATNTVVQWSPDGRYAYFTTWSSSADSLWRVNADGSDLRRLFSTPASADLLTNVSPNGQWILLKTNDGVRGQQLRVITSDGRDLHSVVPAVPRANVEPDAEWSPRGDLLLVVTLVTRHGGKNLDSFSTYVTRPAGGARHEVPHIPGLGVWSPDERFIAYGDEIAPRTATTVAAEVVIVSIATGLPRTLLTATVPQDPTASYAEGLGVAGWQPAPGSAPRSICAAGQAPF